MTPNPMTQVPMRFETTPLMWTAHGIYDDVQCRAAIARIEAGAPSLATNNPMYRDQDRVMHDDPETASQLFDRLRPHLPETMGELTLGGLNERFRYYRYRPGQRFAPHMDHWYRPTPTRITLLSVLVYFNDNFEGGQTRFMEQVDTVVVPRPGLAAIFQHKIRHEGCAVERGIKYAMRTDVYYDAPHPIEMVLPPLS